MKIWLPESVYRKVKDDESYKIAVEQLESYIGHSSDATSYFGDDIPEDIYQNFSETVKGICGDGYEKLLYELSEVIGDEDYNINIVRLRDIRKRIDSLPQSDNKIICQIYATQIRLLIDYYEDDTYYSETVRQMRQQVLDLYNSSETKNFDEETFNTYLYLSFELFFSDFKNYQGKNDYNYFKLKMKEFFELSEKINKEVSDRFDTDYYKNMVAYNKTWSVFTFYNNINEFCSLTRDEFLEFDREILEYLSLLDFKYKSSDFMYFKHEFSRMNRFNDYALYEELTGLYNTLAKKIKYLLNDKKNLMESLNYLATSYHKNFLFYIQGMKDFEKEIMSGLPDKFPNLNIQITGKFSDIELTEKEQEYLDNATDEERKRLQLNLGPFKSKIYG